MTIQSLKHLVQREAYHIVIWQLAGVLLLAMLAWLIKGQAIGLSVLAGGLTYGIANLLFVWRVFRFAGAQQMTQFMAAFFFGEMLKMILSAVLLLLIVKYLPVSLLSVLIGLIGAIVSFWVVCIWHFSRIGISKGVAR